MFVIRGDFELVFKKIVKFVFVVDLEKYEKWMVEFGFVWIFDRFFIFGIFVYKMWRIFVIKKKK